MIITQDLLDTLYELKIFPKYNCAPPENGTYGWLKAGNNLHMKKDTITIDQNTGIYGKIYKASKGGENCAGLFNIGAFSYSYSPFHKNFSVGRYCSISNGITLLDSDHPLDYVTTSIITFKQNNMIVKPFSDRSQRGAYPFRVNEQKPYPKIGHDVWIGRDCSLSMGVEIGTGAVIAANSVVTKDVPPYAIVGGVPAKIIRFRFPDEIIDGLLESEWWKLTPNILLDMEMDLPESFLKRISSICVDDLIEPLQTISIDRNGFSLHESRSAA